MHGQEPDIHTVKAVNNHAVCYLNFSTLFTYRLHLLIYETGRHAPVDEEANKASTTPDIAADADSYVEDPDYPEGGLAAWLVVLGAWCAMIPPIGLLNTIGVLQAWVAEHQLQGYTESTVGWIFSTYAFFLYICGAQVGE